MTYKLYEVAVITCDECGKKEEGSFSKDKNPILQEGAWNERLKDKGWTMDDATQRHLCPECSESG